MLKYENNEIIECEIPDGAVIEAEIEQRVFVGIVSSGDAYSEIAFQDNKTIATQYLNGYSLKLFTKILILSIPRYQKMWITTDKDGTQLIYIDKPIRSKNYFTSLIGWTMEVPTHKRINQTWEDEPREIWVKS